MASAIIRSNESFEAWLSLHGNFNDSQVVNISPPRSGASIGESTSVTVKQWIDGSPSAGATMKFATFDIGFHGISKWTLHGEHRPDYWIEGIRVVPTKSGISFTIKVPGNLSVECTEIEASTPEHSSVIVQPYLNINVFAVYCRQRGLPSPHEWIAFFACHGIGTTWRYRNGVAKLASEVPSDNYTGWYLQIPERVPQTSEGLFVAYCNREHQGFSVAFENKDDMNNQVLRAAARIVAEFPGAEIRSGNCCVSGSIWKRFVDTGESPKLEEVIRNARA